jgi:hypothetical protein
MSYWETVWVQSTWIGPGGNIGDVYQKGRFSYPPLVFRLPTYEDGSPTFSRCTLPLVLFKSYEANYHESLMAVLGQVYDWSVQHAAVDPRVTFIVRPPTSHCHLLSAHPLG